MAASMGRTGRNVHQPTGYRAFLPRPLPYDPPLRYDGIRPEPMWSLGVARGARKPVALRAGPVTPHDG